MPIDSAGARIDGGVDAGELAVRRHQRAARIARIDRGIGLDEELVIAGADLRARQRRDDAHGHGLADTEGIADREHHIAHLQLVAVAELHRRQALALGVDLEHGEIGVAVGEQDLGLEFAPVGKRHDNVLAALHDMIVGEDDAVGAHDDAGAQRLLHPLAHFRRGAEETLKERVGEKRVHRRLDDRTRIDIDDGGRNALDDGREGELHLPGRRAQKLCRARGRELHGGHQRCDDKESTLHLTVLPECKRAAHWPPLSNTKFRRESYALLSASSPDGPESSPFASTSRSTNSIKAISALSPKRKPAFMMRI